MPSNRGFIHQEVENRSVRRKNVDAALALLKDISASVMGCRISRLKTPKFGVQLEDPGAQRHLTFGSRRCPARST